MKPLLLRLYDSVVLHWPRTMLAAVGLLVVFSAWQVPKFKLDASADSLVLENDKDLAYYRSISKAYKSKDFLVITYTPFSDMLSDESLDGLRALKADLSQLDRVESVISILDVPLLDIPDLKISEFSNNKKTLETPGIDKKRALKEFTTSPIYRKLLMSPDGKTTAVLVNFERDERYFFLLEKRNDLRDKRRTVGLSEPEEKELARVSQEFKDYVANFLDKESRDIEAVRRIMDRQRDKAEMFLGGVAMITTDMIHFIESDLSTFGWGVAGFMVLIMWLFFRRKRWVALPLGCCILTAVVMIGYLGFVDWRVTVISSNFISILLIITISLTIHLIVRYGELYAENPGTDQRKLVRETVRHMAQPCFYTAITTIAAFCSLVVSDIRPVIDFGWIMTIGIGLAFVLSFVFFPAVLVLMRPKSSVSAHDTTKHLTQAIASFTLKHRDKILGVSAVIAVLCVSGTMKLQVENRFIDYFKPTTEIYQGMSVIDTKLGGTTPLDVIIDADQDFYAYLEEMKATQGLEDVFGDPFAEHEEKEPDNYWFNAENLEFAERIHDRLEQLPQIGKVFSIATAIKVVKKLNGGKMPDDYDLALIRKKFPEKKTFLNPYLSKDANQIRINMRIEETDRSLNRGALIEKIKNILVQELGIEENRVRFTGMAVLYNNMLHSLFRSQILTLGTVFLAILLMFIVLFRSVYLAFLAIVPNVLSAGLILGIMGWFEIPLDMMTITIAAITIGIAVDDTIHYVYRFKSEFFQRREYHANVERCHGSIGRAIYYTSITVTLGFSILAMSNFFPTVYFGVLTGLAMIIALVNNLTLLPALIILFKPLGPEQTAPSFSEAK